MRTYTNCGKKVEDDFDVCYCATQKGSLAANGVFE